MVVKELGALQVVVREGGDSPEDYRGDSQEGMTRSRLEMKVKGGEKAGEPEAKELEWLARQTSVWLSLMWVGGGDLGHRGQL